MSGIATLSFIPVSRLPELATVPSGGEFHRKLASLQITSIDYGYSGWILGTLLPVLKNEYGIDLMRADPETAKKLDDASGGTVFVLTHQERDSYLDRLDPNNFSAEALQRSFEAFNATEANGVGGPMLEGITFLRRGLEQLTPELVAILAIG